MRIIPAIDIINGQCVRLTKGNYSTKKVYHKNPVEMAKRFEGEGLQYLHLVDLDGAKANHIVNYKVLENITSCTNLMVDFGGGLKSDEDLQIAFSCGASQVTGGSIAVKAPEQFLHWLEEYGPEKIILGADFKNGKIVIDGWFHSSEADVLHFIKQHYENGIRKVICTDVSKDGVLGGPSFEIYTTVIRQIPVDLIASGGVSCIEDLLKLRELGCEGAIIGKAFYEGNISLKELVELC
jgi:phosphoribosylformimino-5-aminoimidazole carboxamide ribotide isomerase